MIRVPEKVHKNFSPRLHDSCKFDASGIFNFSSPHTKLRLTAAPSCGWKCGWQRRKFSRRWRGKWCLSNHKQSFHVSPPRLRRVLLRIYCASMDWRAKDEVRKKLKVKWNVWTRQTAATTTWIIHSRASERFGILSVRLLINAFHFYFTYFFIFQHSTLGELRLKLEGI